MDPLRRFSTGTANHPARRIARGGLRIRIPGSGRSAGGGREHLRPIRSRPRSRTFQPKAKRVIFLFMHGGVSHIDSFDPKERLYQRQRQASADQASAGLCRRRRWAAGEAAVGLQELRPERHSGKRSVPAHRVLRRRPLRDSLDVRRGRGSWRRDAADVHGHEQRGPAEHGRWTVYGLGTENRNLPGFVTIKPTLSHGGSKNWGSAFLPGAYQGTAIGNAGLKVEDVKGEPIEYLLQKKLTSDQQRYELDMLQSINRRHAEVRHNDPNLEARIQSFELAFRMQAQAPEAFEVEKESEATKKLYGLDEEVTRDFGWQCLLARRLAERDVRFIQCTHSYKWDQHSDILEKHPANAKEVDKPIAGLLKDL